jgi:PadR family transcriptional regulator PadR
MRTTLAGQRVLRALLDSPTTDHYGLEIMKATGLKSGSLYPILRRLEEAGWIEGRWEEIDPKSEGRPRRRLYRLTPEGLTNARAARERTAHDLGFNLAGG